MYITRFTVKGRHYFPMDMLRYDSCYPMRPMDVDAMILTPNNDMDMWGSERTVHLAIRHTHQKDPVVTRGRWTSYSWPVQAIEKPQKV